MYRLATESTEKRRIEENASVSFLHSCSARAKRTLFSAKSARAFAHFIFAKNVQNNYGIKECCATHHPDSCTRYQPVLSMQSYGQSVLHGEYCVYIPVDSRSKRQVIAFCDDLLGSSGTGTSCSCNVIMEVIAVHAPAKPASLIGCSSRLSLSHMDGTSNCISCICVYSKTPD